MIRKAIAAAMIGASIIGSGSMGAQAAPKQLTRTISVVGLCQYEDGSGPTDTHKNAGCLFRGSRGFDVINFDGGRRAITVKHDAKGKGPNLREGLELRATFNTNTRQVLSIRMDGGKRFGTTGKVRIYW